MATFPLQKGSKGEAVKLLQKGLNLYSELRGASDRIAEDGEFGAKTEALLLKLLYRKTVSEALWKTLERAAPAAAGRLAEQRRTGKPSADQVLAKVVENEAAIFKFLLQTYATYDKADQATRERLKNAFGAAFDLAARQRLRVAKYEQAQRDIFMVRISDQDPKYGALIKKYVSGQPVFGVGAVQAVAIAAVAIAALIIGAVATVAVVNWLTPAYSESTVDFKKTKEIQDILDKLPKEDQVKLEQEVEKQIDQAYVTGKRDGKFGGALGILKPIGIGLGLLLLYERFGRPQAAAALGGRK